MERGIIEYCIQLLLDDKTRLILCTVEIIRSGDQVIKENVNDRKRDLLQAAPPRRMISENLDKESKMMSTLTCNKYRKTILWLLTHTSMLRVRVYAGM